MQWKEKAMPNWEQSKKNAFIFYPERHLCFKESWEISIDSL